MVYTVDIINELNLFWQYPARTEETFYLQNKDDENFIGIPWATIHDKKVNLNQGFFKLMTRIQKNKEYYTCCQHIAFYKFITIWKALGIKKVYISHKRKGIDIVDNITLLPMPLYAVNIEDTNFNKEFQNIEDKLTIEKPYLYSFIGGYQQADYMSSIRPNIFKMQHPDNTFIKNTGVWHLDKLVFGSKQNISGELYKTKEHDIKTGIYNEVLKKSRFSLCPSGSGPNSIRFWESLAIGSIPVLLSDTLELPYHELWCDAILEVKEEDLLNLPDILDNISPDKERKMRENCIKIYEDFKNNYKGKCKNKVLFTSYMCEKNEPLVLSILNKWKELNENYDILYFSDKDIENFFKNHKYHFVYKLMKNGVAIADFFRICYIEKHGGYWFDIDIEPFKVIIPEFGNIHLFNAGFNNISYMFIGGNKNQKLFQDVIDIVSKNIIDNSVNKKKHVLDITGPRIIQNLICNRLNIVNRDGCLVGDSEPKYLLKESNYEFVYTKINLKSTKTDTYIKLQKKFNKLPYQNYNFI